MHDPRFHPEILSHRSTDLLPVSSWFSSAGCVSPACVLRLMCSPPSAVGPVGFCGHRSPGQITSLRVLPQGPCQSWGGEEPSGALCLCCPTGCLVTVSFCCWVSQPPAVLLRLLRAASCGDSAHCLQSRDLFQLRKVSFCAALIPFANHG